MLSIYNTINREKGKISQKKIRLFVCGPTVYDGSHIGHARTYIFFDMLVKYLRSQDYDVYYLQNITDIDDKIINKAKGKGVIWQEVSERNFEKYQKDMKALHINSVDMYAKATDYIDQIKEQIKILIEKDYAYVTNSGVYYRTKKFKDYGKLSGQVQENLYVTDEDSKKYEQDKEDSSDFAIWKKSEKDEPMWDSPWGQGRPGWHIEDTAITKKVFESSQYELHGGAKDLIFPHHEAEIALMESAYEIKPMVNTWIHTGFLNVDNEKMSKSLNNFVTINDILKEYSAQTLRLFFFQHHYRSPINYSSSGLKKTQALQKRIKEFLQRLQEAKLQRSGQKDQYIQKQETRFHESIDDDFNTPKALSDFLELVSHINKKIAQEKVTQKDQEDVLSFVEKINKIFSIIETTKQKEVTREIKSLLEKRDKFREQGDYKQSDKIRDQIQSLGYKVVDTDKGSSVKEI